MRIHSVKNTVPARTLLRPRAQLMRGIVNEIVQTRGATVYRTDVEFTPSTYNRPGRRGTVEHARMVETAGRLYKEGLSYLKISSKMDVCLSTARNLVLSSGVEIRRQRRKA